MGRPDIDTYFLRMAQLVATRSTCCRRAVGCVLVDKDNHVLSTGYNGNPPGFVHCIDSPCEGANLPSGTGLDLCQATHAEINALLHCRDVPVVDRIYSTTSPCNSCAKALLATSAREIIFLDYYSQHQAQIWWTSAGRSWTQHKGPL